MFAGIDIVQISRIQKAMQNPGFASKILTDAEIACGTHNSIQSTAASFAAKEAFSKALGTGMRGFGFGDISVLHNSLGKPYLEFSPRVDALLKSRGITAREVTISHEKEYAVATVILTSDSTYTQYINALCKFDIQCPSNAITPQMVQQILPKRKRDIHKGNCGRLFLLAGSLGMTGAAIMASRAALRSGAGLITLGCAKSINSIFECSIPEVMTLPLDDTDGVINFTDADKILQKSAMSDCVLAGPGLTAGDDIAKLVQLLTANCKGTLVVDADGINVISRNINILNDARCPMVMTPHIGEFSRLTGLTSQQIMAQPDECARDFAKKYNVTLVLKSHQTIVATSDGQIYCNMLGNPGMATGGTGDVLAGTIASLCAQGFAPEDAAKAGVYIHSLGADMAASELGEYGLTPGDIIKYIPYAIKYTTEQN